MDTHRNETSSTAARLVFIVPAPRASDCEVQCTSDWCNINPKVQDETAQENLEPKKSKLSRGTQKAQQVMQVLE